MDADTDDVARAVDVIRGSGTAVPRFGVILGSGLADVVGSWSDRRVIDYARIPGFARTTALGHAGRLVRGHVRGLPAVALQGRCHLYEGHTAAALAFPVRVLRALGVEFLIVTNAAGGLDPSFRSGDVMILRDHVRYQRLDGFGIGEPGGPRRDGPVYDERLIAAALAAARVEHVSVRQGVYVGVTGPNYETRAEYRMFRRIGGAAVGMSTIVEALAASSLGMRVLGLSIIANVARPDAPEEVRHEDVLRAVSGAADGVRRIVDRLIREFAGDGAIGDTPRGT